MTISRWCLTVLWQYTSRGFDINFIHFVVGTEYDATHYDNSSLRLTVQQFQPASCENNNSISLALVSPALLYMYLVFSTASLTVNILF